MYINIHNNMYCATYKCIKYMLYKFIYVCYYYSCFYNFMKNA